MNNVFLEMQRTRTILYVILCFFCFFNAYAENLLSFDRIVLAYNIKGDYEEGIETIYKNGADLCIETQSEVKPFNSKEFSPYHRKKIITGNYIYDLDMISKSGTRIPNIVKEYENLSVEEKMNVYNILIKEIKPFINNTKNQQQSSKTIQYFGKKCDIVETSFFRAYIWNNLTLRREIFIPFKEIREIKDLQINGAIDFSVFWVPNDFVITDIDVNKENEQIKKMIANFIESEGKIKKGIK